MNFKTEITKLHYDKKAKGLFVDLLEFLSIFYGAVSSIRKACTTNVNKVISKYAATVVKWWKLIEGKTYGELGFGFTAK